MKLTSAPSADDARALRIAMTDVGAHGGVVVHTGREDISLGPGVRAVPATRVLACRAVAAALFRA